MSWIKRTEVRFREWFTGRGRTGKAIRIDTPQNILADIAAPKILFMRQDRIGDMLVSLPVVRAVRAQFPHAQIDVLLGTNNIGVGSVALRYANSILCYEKKIGKILMLLWRIRRTRYDVVVDLMDNASATSTFLFTRMKSRYTLGIEKENADAYTHNVPLLDKSVTHIVERLAQFLLAFGIEPSTTNLLLEYPLANAEIQIAQERVKKSSEQLLGVNISSGYDEMYWGSEHWIRLIDHIQKEFPRLDIVLFSSPGYAEELAIISSATCVRIAPSTRSFHEFAAMIAQCTLFCTPDTSVIHVCAAHRIPVVGVYNYSDKSLIPWTPYKSPGTMLYTDTNHVRDIKFDDVYSAVQTMVRNVYMG